MVDDGPWLYYKLTNEPKGSGELKTVKLFLSDIHTRTSIKQLKLLFMFCLADLSIEIPKTVSSLKVPDEQLRPDLIFWRYAHEDK